MEESIFSTLCDLADELSRLERAMEPGTITDRLQAIVERLDAVIDRTVGIEPCMPTHEEEES